MQHDLELILYQIGKGKGKGKGKGEKELEYGDIWNV